MDNHKQNIPEAIETAKRKLSDDQQANADTSAINKRRKSGDKATVKTEPPDEIESTTSSIQVTIKDEPIEEHDESAAADVSGVSTISTSSNAATVAIKKEPINDDPSAKTDDDHDDSPAVDVNDIAGASTSPLTIPIKKESTNDDTSVKVDAVSSSAVIVKTEPNTSTQAAIADSSVSSSTLRPSCRFGIKCYRRNPTHRSSEAHPGDSDYRRPSFPIPPLGTPACPFGNSCYRRNPIHFQQYSHPSD
ncbi:PREDICTED: aprataxin and PNK-like factor isoform X2 [Drosophila arizonae]|nr:PREDICTED: aprataxin and PNK-like factor isoform X2 [Drosophila arizonae]